MDYLSVAVYLGLPTVAMGAVVILTDGKYKLVALGVQLLLLATQIGFGIAGVLQLVGE